MKTQATTALETFAEMAPELRRAAILDDSGELVAASTGDPAWSKLAGAVVDAVDGVEGEPFDSGHVALEEGEVFVVRENGLVMVAVTERLVLASLTLFDMRMSLRGLDSGGADA